MHKHPSAAILATLLAAAAPPIAQARQWTWRYTAPGLHAEGTFTTSDAPDAAGFYRITAIAGTRNGVAIASLAPEGQPIPGNAPHALDNRVRAAAPPLTKAGFGFRLADGTWANPFVLDGKALEYLSPPPHTPGAGPEVEIRFTASPR